MLTAPIDAPLNLTTQTVLIVGSYAIWIIMTLVALRMWKAQRTPIFLIIIFAAAFGGLMEPLYDEGMMLWFHTPGLWSSFTAFGIPQPWWVYSGYVTLYGATAVFICHRIGKGLMTPNALYLWAGVEFVSSCVFEMYAINGGAMTYWGPHVFRIFEYPLAIGVLETAQVITFSVMAAELRQRATHNLQLLGLFVLFPCTFYFANFGAGGPMIVALHLDTPSPAMVTVTTLLSMTFALVLIWAAAQRLAVIQALPHRN